MSDEKFQELRGSVNYATNLPNELTNVIIDYCVAVLSPDIRTLMFCDEELYWRLNWVGSKFDGYCLLRASRDNLVVTLIRLCKGDRLGIQRSLDALSYIRELQSQHRAQYLWLCHKLTEVEMPGTNDK
jgi:hypothetical protein